MLGNGADLQAVLGMRGLRHLFKAKDPKAVFLVQEQEAPYAVSFVGLDPAFIDMAEHKLARALKLWADCSSMNIWPGYPSRICWASPPGWAYQEEESKS
jgi:hypothetical protein